MLFIIIDISSYAFKLDTAEPTISIPNTWQRVNTQNAADANVQIFVPAGEAVNNAKQTITIATVKLKNQAMTLEQYINFVQKQESRFGDVELLSINNEMFGKNKWPCGLLSIKVKSKNQYNIGLLAIIELAQHDFTTFMYEINANELSGDEQKKVLEQIKTMFLCLNSNARGCVSRYQSDDAIARKTYQHYCACSKLKIFCFTAHMNTITDLFTLPLSLSKAVC